MKEPRWLSLYSDGIRAGRSGFRRDIYGVLVERPLGRPRRRWEDNIKMDLKEIGIDVSNWIRLAQDRVQWRAFVSTVTNLRVP
jgi:hypothetical protein